jgi:predicted RNA binding protein YcfA (HicA-like mRNA interferase family)
MTWSSQDVVRVLAAFGFSLARRSGEDQYTKPGHPRPVTVPRSKKSIPPGTLASIWRQAGITKADAEKAR